MESNQDGLKALLQEKDCVGVPANEEYQEYLVDYLLDENFFENELADYCVFPIGYNQSIVYIPDLCSHCTWHSFCVVG